MPVAAARCSVGADIRVEGGGMERLYTGYSEGRIREEKFAIDLADGAETLQIRFSPKVRQQFARLEAMVDDGDHFGAEILEELRDRAAGNPLSV